MVTVPPIYYGCSIIDHGAVWVPRLTACARMYPIGIVYNTTVALKTPIKGKYPKINSSGRLNPIG